MVPVPTGHSLSRQSYCNGGPREGPMARAVQECLHAMLWNGTVGLAPFGHDLPAESAVVPLTWHDTEPSSGGVERR
ncbi:hypothetical protein GCM10010388_66310 [Streptomyces mauvecolor]